MMLLIINIKYFAVETKQLSVMLLISIIKYLIVMPDVKDLAQAAQNAAVAPESVNVVDTTASVNQPAQPVDNVPQTPQVDTANQSSTQVETIDDVVKRICADGHSYVMTTVITNIDCQERTGRNGSPYLNAFVTIASPVKDRKSVV